jgi:head-tail adaptor
MIQPGLMRDDIIVQRRTIIKDNYGSEEEIFTDYLYLKSSAKYNAGGRGIDNMEVFNSRTITFTTYFRPITESMRIIYDSKTYRILFIAELGYREGLQITTELINE